MCKLVLIDDTTTDQSFTNIQDRSLSLVQIIDTAMIADIVDKVFVFKGSAKGCGDLSEPARVPVTKHLSISTRQMVV